MGFGGSGGMWEGIRGNVGGNFGGNVGPGAAPGGAPFAGIPEELREAVSSLVATEPDHGLPSATFTATAPDPGRLTLWSLIRARWSIAVWSLFFLVVETLGFQSGPFLTKIGIDDGIGKSTNSPHHLNIIVATGVAYILTVLLTVLVERKRVRNTGLLAANVMNDLRVNVFTHIQRLSRDYFTEEKAGVIMTRMTSDIEVLQNLLQDGIAQFCIQGLTMVVVTVLLFVFNVQLALITCALVLPMLIATSLWFRNASARTYLLVRDTLAAVIGDIAESLSGVRVVAAYNRQKNNVIHHRNVVGRYRKANRTSAKVTAAYTASSDFIGLGGQLALLLIGGDMVIHGHLSVGTLSAFILYLGSFFQPIQQIVQLYNTYQQGQAAVIKLRTLLETVPSVAESPDAYELPPVEGKIDFDDVTFGYNPKVPVLEGVNLHIAAGEIIAFVGATGAGKSTIAKLVTRFYDPTEGTVRIDGHRLQDVTLNSLRRQLGVVPQEAFLFSGSIRDNVAFSRPEATDDEVLAAINAVGLQDLIDRLPYGIDTEVHERGQSLASGERQLIALARAFIASPRVLVLDEATSNLDLKSEGKVETALDLLLDGRTAILIAHRLTTAMRADRIIVVDDGKIVESGSHDELVSKDGRYAEMYSTWSNHQGEQRPSEFSSSS